MRYRPRAFGVRLQRNLTLVALFLALEILACWVAEVRRREPEVPTPRPSAAPRALMLTLVVLERAEAMRPRRGQME